MNRGIERQRKHKPNKKHKIEKNIDHGMYLLLELPCMRHTCPVLFRNYRQLLPRQPLRNALLPN